MKGPGSSRLAVWKKRFRIMSDEKPTVQVQTTSRLETMTVTQEWRFRQLERSRSGERSPARSGPASRAWYTLTEACQHLASTSEGLLRAAADGEIACYVASEGLRGRWGAEGDPASRVGRADVSHLRLTADACREVATYGSTNLTVLRHPTINNNGAQFLLEEPLWVAPERILLKHPLPAPGRH
jgi:hypothetical protein